LRRRPAPSCPQVRAWRPHLGEGIGGVSRARLRPWRGAAASAAPRAPCIAAQGPLRRSRRSRGAGPWPPAAVVVVVAAGVAAGAAAAAAAAAAAGGAAPRAASRPAARRSDAVQGIPVRLLSALPRLPLTWHIPPPLHLNGPATAPLLSEERPAPPGSWRHPPMGPCQPSMAHTLTVHPTAAPAPRMSGAAWGYAAPPRPRLSPNPSRPPGQLAGAHRLGCRAAPCTFLTPGAGPPLHRTSGGAPGRPPRGAAAHAQQPGARAAVNARRPCPATQEPLRPPPTRPLPAAVGPSSRALRSPLVNPRAPFQETGVCGALQALS
jgi:hypothetical protein